MNVEISDEKMPIQLQKRGWYRSQKAFTATIEEPVSGATDVTVGNTATLGIDAFRNGEWQRVDRNSSRPTMEFVEVSEKAQEALGVASQAGPYMPVGSVGREEEDEAELTEIDEYIIFIDQQSNPVSLCVLPLEFEGLELVGSGVSVSTGVSLCGKSGGVDVMRCITAWKLTFREHESFHILVKITQMSGAKRWVKLGKPRSDYKETEEDVFFVAKFLAFMKKEPYASEDRVWNHLLEGNVLSMAFDDLLRKHEKLFSQARKTLLSPSREKVTQPGKRMLLLNDESSDEDDYPWVKKPKMDHRKPEDVSVRENESEEEFYNDEEFYDDEDETDDEPGDSLCAICDDGGYLLCCDGPCMRAFHPRPEDGIGTQCKTLGFPNGTDIEKFKRGWFCTNCKTKKHQCYVCGELGDSEEASGSRRHVFVCDVASCGKFYHPRCIANKLKPFASGAEREALVKGIRAGEQTFTCPLHRCQKCGKGEEKKEKDLNLATCRRCPAAWHVKCLPSNLSFEGYEIRAWELGKRFIIYCTNHKIFRDLGTPERNHIKFKVKISEATFKKPQKKVSTVGNERPGFSAKVSSSAASQISGRSADTAKPATQKTLDDVKRLVDGVIEKSRQTITEESVTAKLFLPKIYQRKEFNWMLKGRFDSILNGARAAMQMFKQNSKNWEDAKLKCAPEQVHAISLEEDRLRTFLAPTLHGKRYTSYGRHFTKVEKLQKVVDALQPYILDGDTIVDFSCGDNTFSRLLHDALLDSEKSQCQFKNFDIFSPKDTLGFQRRDWLSVGRDDCGHGDNLVIGLNPPFAHTDRFISHALTMNPRVVVLIIPPLKRPLPRDGYQCLLDDPTTMAEKSFYLPGSVHGLNEECLEQGNNVAPHLYIFARTPVFEMSNPPPTSFWGHPEGVPHSFRGSRPPEFRGSRPPEFRGSRPPEFRGSRPPEFRGACPPQFRGACPPQFRGARPPEFGGFHPPQFRGSRSPHFGGLQPPQFRSSCLPTFRGWLPADQMR